MALGPHTPTQRLLEVATGVFINRDVALKQEKDQRAQLQGKVQAQILAGAIADPPQPQTNQGPKEKPVSDKGAGRTPCHGCDQTRHWSKECPNNGSPPGPCPVCKK